MNKIRKGDEVIVITGRDKGRHGTVTRRVDAQHLVVEGINIVKKHVRPNPMTGATGGVQEQAMPIDQSNVALYNAATGKADKVAIKVLDDNKRIRVYKSSGDEVKVAK